MSALASAAIATFLVEALQGFVLGDILQIEFLKETGQLAGTLSGVIVAFLIAMNRKINPQNAALLAVAFAEIGLVPAFLAAYLMSFLVRFVERKITNGLDFIVIVIFLIPLARFLGVLFTPLVDGSLLKIGGVIDGAMSTSPFLMGLILGGIVTVVGTSPLSSMALTAMLGLTGVPMAVAALTAFGSSFMNTTILHRLKIGSLKSVISIAIEPLSKADLVSANPVPVYVTNFIGGALAGIVLAYSGLINDAPGTAAPTPGLLVMFGFNPAMEVVKYAAITAAICFTVGIIMSYVFRNYPIKNSEVLPNEDVNSKKA
ncbi:PTS sugar transporter subunit IIC [Nosocomiicoccus ampullae]|uniref:Fructose-specific phosphotransferase system IIC component n=2 Tax=Nosocomiicoccus ampullae TaxID=489910 RepID=A0A9Q2CZI1_9STAP|nr:PTS sugar transporter subunit IIC [Nosocomiicoccus ampullae]MBB5175990.1 fructose-specific phosphotransferase system IIC component [Nosocomiicoccus ampullae]